MNGEEDGCRLGRIEQMIRYGMWSSGRQGIVIGVSGGIDSAVSSALCCKAVGGERVLGLILPSEITPEEDVADSQMLCETLGMKFHVVSISPVIDAYRTLPGFAENPYTIGNLMARTRMAILYYYANRDNLLVCGTSNRTEYLIGYFTKFGDGAGDIEPIIHLYKRDVFALALKLGIPGRIRSKVPSAGLWKGQSDEAEIGLDYPTIDEALASLEANGWKARTPAEEHVLSLVRKSEHKRLPPPALPGSG